MTPRAATTTALSSRERMVAIAYTDGWPAKSVALALGISQDSVKSYLSRVRVKFRRRGRDVGSKVALARALEEEYPDA